MKQIITLIAAAFIFTTANAGVKPYKTPIKIKVENSAALKVSLQAAGKVNIMWTAAETETTTTVYEIQKRTKGGEFKTIAMLMGESFPTYSFREKVNINDGTIEYRVVTSDNNIIISTVTQQVVIL